MNDIQREINGKMNRIRDDYAKNSGEYYKNMRNHLPPHGMRGYYSLCEK